MKKILSIMLAALVLVACNSTGENNDGENGMEPGRILVLYYSQTGATDSVAREIQCQLDADIEEIQLENPYNGTYDETIERCKKEMETGEVPAVKPIKADLGKYDVIFLGYPVWFGTYARPIAGLVKAVDFKDKKVVTFCTFGSGGLQSSTADLAKALPGAKVVMEGYGVRNARISAIHDEVERFLIEHEFKEGYVTPLPAFMEDHPVTSEEKAIFDQACGDYPFPLGTPVAVATRTTDTSTDYMYTVNSKDEDGKNVVGQVFVTVGFDEGSKPEFTQVVR
ncbi:flavodoxin [Sodaliphilus sp.]|uniref:flavodoxin n=1 Tax=Sodaliphilus sp. TaxID=2815818 RepID=UPI00388D9F37